MNHSGTSHHSQLPDLTQGKEDKPDPLGAHLNLLQIQGVLYCSSELSAPWGISIPELSGLMSFLILVEGECELIVEGEPPMKLSSGDLALLPRATPHVVRSDEKSLVENLFELPVEKVNDRYETLRYGGGGQQAKAMYGVVQFDHFAASKLIELLPRVLKIDKSSPISTSWIAESVGFIADEASRERLGSASIITRLADVIVIKAIREWVETAPDAQSGLLSAIKDPKLGRVLSCMHQHPSNDWTVKSLAKEAAISRSGLSAAFTQQVGEPVMQYLARLRMQLAKELLLNTEMTVSEIAAKVGYSSDASFGRTFRAKMGKTPLAMRRQGLDNLPSKARTKLSS